MSVKASVLHGVKDLRVETREVPELSPTEVRVHVQATGLCGSDLHYFNHYRNGDIIVREPLTLGHESAGTVSAVGSSVTSLKVGDKVALEVGQPCKKCERCAEGRYNICKEMRFRSSAKSFPHFQGTLQEFIHQEAEFCYKLPENVPLEMGAILEPLSVAMHSSRRANLAPKSKVLIFGAGAVGLLCAATAKVNGASEVIIADIQGDRVDFAIKNKFADAGIVVPMKRPQTIEDKLAFAKEVAAMASEKFQAGSGTEADAVFECTGVESCFQASIFATRAGGVIMAVGMGNPIQTLPISAAMLREIDIRGSFRYANTYTDAIALVASNNPALPDLSTLISHRFKGLDNIPSAFDMAGRVKDDSGNLVLKVLVEM
ncbi:putative sorbitol dehydrogenase-2 [Coleophoma cylindrospora]|uniref:Putative sorbitol dehydrogenase-2 n=1 Tax=Coleophoma cylindrospora TaxID=1849047 RepID=A0A3D8RSC1_9HELO|nr:putative sorbitol dehydrogenase-2 [Coleophoma cylindrospora]